MHWDHGKFEEIFENKQDSMDQGKGGGWHTLGARQLTSWHVYTTGDLWSLHSNYRIVKVVKQYSSTC